MLEQFLSICATALTHLFIFSFNVIKLICAHFSWNNLYLLLIEKYFLGPVLFRKFNFFFLEHDKFKIFWILWKMTFKINGSLVYCNVSCWQFNWPFLSSTPSLFYYFSCPHLFYEKKKNSSKFSYASGSFSGISKVILVNRIKDCLLSLRFSILASILAWLKKDNLTMNFWLSIKTILSIFSVLLKNKL